MLDIDLVHLFSMSASDWLIHFKNVTPPLAIFAVAALPLLLWLFKDWPPRPQDAEVKGCACDSRSVVVNGPVHVATYLPNPNIAADDYLVAFQLTADEVRSVLVSRPPRRSDGAID